jgi:hypothetical protein
LTIAERITAEIARWPDVTVVAHGSHFVEFRIGRRELGHLHGGRLADITFPVRIREQLVAASGRCRIINILNPGGSACRSARNRMCPTSSSCFV